MDTRVEYTGKVHRYGYTRRVQGGWVAGVSGKAAQWLMVCTQGVYIHTNLLWQ